MGFSRGDIAKIHAGMGTGKVEVLSVNGNEASVKHLATGETRTLYTAHLFKDAECIRETAERRRQAAAKIGTNKRR